MMAVLTRCVRAMLRLFHGKDDMPPQPNIYRELALIRQALATGAGVWSQIRSTVGDLVLHLTAVEHETERLGLALNEQGEVIRQQGETIARQDVILQDIAGNVATILAALQPPPGAVAATMSVNGVQSAPTGGNTFMAQIKDNDPGARIEVQWQDVRGVKVDADEAWSVGDDTPTATITPDPDNSNVAILVPGSEMNDDGDAPRAITVTVVGTNEDGTTVTAVDTISVGASDAVAGTFTVTPGN